MVLFNGKKKNKRTQGIVAEIGGYQLDKAQRFIHYYNRLKSIAISRFKYENMPPEIDVRFLETTLFEMGFGVFYKDKFADLYVALTCMYGGELDIYNTPSLFTAYASNGYQYELTNRDGVMLWNNELRENGVVAASYFATRLANAESVVDINMSAQKTPVVVLASEEERLTFVNVMEQYEDSAYSIHGTKDLDLNRLKTLDLKAPFIADKGQEIKNQIWNEALTYYGIPNVVANKKERMITDEVQRMQGGVMASAGSDLEMRRECFDKVNRMFGLNIKVSMKDWGEDIDKNVSRETFEKEEVVRGE